MKPPRCPFYPDSCTVERHANMQHVWRVKRKSVLDGHIKVGNARPKGGVLVGLTADTVTKDTRSIHVAASSKQYKTLFNDTRKAEIANSKRSWNKGNRAKMNRKVMAK